PPVCDPAQCDLALGAPALARLGVAVRDRVAVLLPRGVATLLRTLFGRPLGCLGHVSVLAGLCGLEPQGMREALGIRVWNVSYEDRASNVRHMRVAVLLLCAAALVAGCGDDDEETTV